MTDYNRDADVRPTGFFDIEGEVRKIGPFGSGHINDTFRVETDRPGGKNYLLQRINHRVFPNVEGLMQNTKIVLAHLKAKLAHLGEAQVEKATLTLIPTKGGGLYHRDEAGNYWRMFLLLEGTKSYDIVTTAAQAYAGGRAFGEFQKLLADLDANKLVEVLPNFQNIAFRLDNLKKAAERDVAGRLGEVRNILGEVLEREADMRTVLEMGLRGELPLRITHNDTKFNNVLLDQNDQVQCVIDLDTVMPGYVAYDFGDAVRNIINPAAEDEADLSKIVLNIPLFKAYTEGYMSEAEAFLTEAETESLLHGVFMVAYMQVVRFLTDYLEGDTYYKTHYPGHNLVRTKAQFKLVRELERHRDLLADILQTADSGMRVA